MTLKEAIRYVLDNADTSDVNRVYKEFDESYPSDEMSQACSILENYVTPHQTDQVEDGNDDRLYERGFVVAHCSDVGGIPDVGISVGLGGGKMLYVGDTAKSSGAGIRIWGKERGYEIIVGQVEDFGAARDMVEEIGLALNNPI
jgi:hypothetical protein